MIARIQRWLSPTAELVAQVRALRGRVEELERAELEREANVQDQLDKLAKLYKRLRTREARAQDNGGEDATVDPISALILARRNSQRLGG